MKIITQLIELLKFNRKPKSKPTFSANRLEIILFVKENGDGELQFSGNPKELMAAIEKAGDIISNEMSKQPNVQIKKTNIARIVIEPHDGVKSNISLIKRGGK